MLLHKLLPVFVLPIGLAALLVVLGWRKQWRWFGVAGVAILILSSIPVVGHWAIGQLEGAYPPVRVADAPTADVVLVLGGTMGPAMGPGFVPNWSEAVERFEAGVQLVQSGRAKKLLFTAAPNGVDAEENTEGAAMRRIAIERGVRPEQIELTGRVLNTADESRQLAAYVSEHRVKRVLLVTSAWHMPRATRQFRKVPCEIVPFPVDYRATSTLPSAVRFADFLPSAGRGLELTELAMRECYGIAFYSVFGN